MNLSMSTDSIPEVNGIHNNCRLLIFFVFLYDGFVQFKNFSAGKLTLLFEHLTGTKIYNL
jgi:hypothetical protein